MCIYMWVFVMFLSVTSSKACASRNLFFFFSFFSPDFHEFRRSMMSICLYTEVKLQWATLLLGWVAASVHYLCL